MHVFSSEGVKDHLEAYFAQSQRALKGNIDENLCLLCIQCFEVSNSVNQTVIIFLYIPTQDALYKQYSCKCLGEKVDFAERMLDRSHQALRAYEAKATISIDYLEAVACARYWMMEVAALLHSVFGDQQSTQEQQQLAFQLVQIAEELCTDPHINTIDFTDEDAVGPAVYLLRLLMRQYGSSCLKKVSGEHHWIVPNALRTGDQV